MKKYINNGIPIPSPTISFNLQNDRFLTTKKVSFLFVNFEQEVWCVNVLPIY